MSSSRRKSASPEAPSNALANIEFLIDGNGDITIGRVGPIPCVATAADEEQCLVMLQRRSGESLAELLQRLDVAIGDAYEHCIFIDEINAPPRSKPSGRSRT
jgi:hypothetical protein